MVKFYLLSLVAFCVLGCASSSADKRPATPPQNVHLIAVPDIDPASIGNMRIAIVSKRKSTNLLLVHPGNSKYLKPIESGKARQDMALHEFDYQAPYLSGYDQTSVVIVDDEVMAKLVALLDHYQFYEYAQSCTAEQVKSADWPERDAIFVDNNDRLAVLMREESLFDASQRPTKQAELYRTLKYNILQAQQLGYRPMQMRKNIDSSRMFPPREQ